MSSAFKESTDLNRKQLKDEENEKNCKQEKAEYDPQILGCATSVPSKQVKCLTEKSHA